MPHSRHPVFLALLALGSAFAFSCSGSTLDDSCPYAQWDCSPSWPHCNIKVYDKPSASGCVCNRSRPTSAAQCKAGEVFVCLSGLPTSAAQVPGTWDGVFNVDCQCSPWPEPTSDNCPGACAYTYTGISTNGYQCSIASDQQCDGVGCNVNDIACNCAQRPAPGPE
jgi:hypothetical protein